jgi:hypothetical protein
VGGGAVVVAPRAVAPRVVAPQAEVLSGDAAAAGARRPRVQDRT